MNHNNAILRNKASAAKELLFEIQALFEHDAQPEWAGILDALVGAIGWLYRIENELIDDAPPPELPPFLPNFQHGE